MNDKEVLQAQFDGFQSTPLLWVDDNVLGLTQFKLEYSCPKESLPSIVKTPRLGKLVEQFVNHLMIKSDSYSCLIQNIQIQKDRITLGELDSVFQHQDKTIHLEIIYKYYLYDDLAGESELDKWIGPNKKDSLNHKLTKLITKQLPRLYLPETREILSKYDFKVDDVLQRVNFRAQLFIPYNSRKIKFDLINEDCIAGTYISYNELSKLSENLFFIPQKLDWLSAPHENADFTNLDNFKNEMQIYVNESRSPLCWMKTKQNECQKIFVVWW